MNEQKTEVALKQKILDSAETLFAKLGFEAASVEKILEEAGCSKGCFYHHYKTKHDLLLTLKEHVIERHQDDLIQRYSSVKSDDPFVRLDSWIDAAIDAYVNIGPIHNVIFQDQPYSRWTISHMKFIEVFVELLEEGNRSKNWVVSSPKLVANYIYRGLLGVIDDHLINQIPIQHAIPLIKQLSRNALEITK